MAKEEKKEKKGGFLRVVFWIVLIYLVANFCWNNKPLYRLIWPSNSTEISTDSVEKLKEKVLETVEETKNEVLKAETAIIPKEDKESLKELIKQKAADEKQ
ncbi:hypothetical protein KAH37_01640 [bacterium]|nr:hypothetical protein [bacterium]